MRRKAKQHRDKLAAEKAKKFVSPVDRIRYAHLNIDFAHHFPADAHGVFAELAGTSARVRTH